MTADIIDISAEREKKNGPDIKHVYIDASGVKWFEYACEFNFGNKEYAFNLWATSIDDCEERLDAIKKSGAVSGQILCEQPN